MEISPSGNGGISIAPTTYKILVWASFEIAILGYLARFCVKDLPELY